jgi:hypothetical protein
MAMPKLFDQVCDGIRAEQACVHQAKSFTRLRGKRNPREMTTGEIGFPSSMIYHQCVNNFSGAP